MAPGHLISAKTYAVIIFLGCVCLVTRCQSGFHLSGYIQADPSPESQGIWQVYPSPTKKWLIDIAMVDQAQGWIVGESGTVLAYQDNQWRRVDSQLESNLVGVDAQGSRANGWLIGNQPVSIARHLDGVWTPIETDARFGLYDIDLYADSDGLIVGGVLGKQLPKRIEILRQRDDQWRSQGSRVVPFALQAVSVLNDGSGWAVGDQFIVPIDEGVVDLEPIPVQANLTAVSTVSPDIAWAVGQEGAFAHFSDGIWSVTKFPAYTHDLTGIDMVSDDEGWAIGSDGTIFSYRDGQWVVHSKWHTFLSLQPETLLGIDMVSSNEGWIVGANGLILHYSH